MFIYLQMIETAEEKCCFEQIYNEYHRLMYYVAYGILHHSQDAEDAVHHAFVKIAENIKKISQPVCPKTKSFVVIITEHTALNMLKKHSRNRELPFVQEISGEHAADFEGDTLAKCILQLQPRQKHVIWLKYHHGYSLREIATMLGISHDAAIKTDQRAKAKLWELYQKEGGYGNAE